VARVWLSVATILAEFASVVFSSREINKASAGNGRSETGSSVISYGTLLSLSFKPNLVREKSG
jgi:hypothetical protein